MKRYQIHHATRYRFSDEVSLLPHTLRLRPREGHELRIESASLEITPAAGLRWHRDVEGNSTAVATFGERTRSLEIFSDVIVQQYDQAPHDFLVADYAVDYPFCYPDEDKLILGPYLRPSSGSGSLVLIDWVESVWSPAHPLQTFALLLHLNQRIYEALSYTVREEEGVQTAEETLTRGSGSCRDSANLFIDAARQLGFAARFVSGYLHSTSDGTSPDTPGSTHAWSEVFIPGAGWKGFDSSNGSLVGTKHIAVGVAMRPESVPPISGSFRGPSGTTMEVDVRVTALA